MTARYVQCLQHNHFRNSGSSHNNDLLASNYALTSLAYLGDFPSSARLTAEGNPVCRGYPGRCRSPWRRLVTIDIFQQFRHSCRSSFDPDCTKYHSRFSHLHDSLFSLGFAFRDCTVSSLSVSLTPTCRWIVFAGIGASFVSGIAIAGCRNCTIQLSARVRQSFA